MRLPPLRERTEDIPELVNHFLSLCSEEGLPVEGVDETAMDRLKRYHWPGNVRELENLVRRLAVLYSQEVLTGDVVKAELADASSVGVPDGEGGGLSGSVENRLKTYFSPMGTPCPPGACTTGDQGGRTSTDNP